MRILKTAQNHGHHLFEISYHDLHYHKRNAIKGNQISSQARKTSTIEATEQRNPHKTNWSCQNLDHMSLWIRTTRCLVVQFQWLDQFMLFNHKLWKWNSILKLGGQNNIFRYLRAPFSDLCKGDQGCMVLLPFWSSKVGREELRCNRNNCVSTKGDWKTV